MFVENLIQGISSEIESRLNEDILISFQEYLLRAGIFTVASNLLATVIFITILLVVLSVVLSVLFSFDMLIALILAIFTPIVVLIVFILIRSEKRLSYVEKSIPDFLRQLSSMLRVGMSLEKTLN